MLPFDYNTEHGANKLKPNEKQQTTSQAKLSTNNVNNNNNNDNQPSENDDQNGKILNLNNIISQQQKLIYNLMANQATKPLEIKASNHTEQATQANNKENVSPRNDSYAKIVQNRSEEINHQNEQPSELVPPDKNEKNDKVKLLIAKYTGDGIKDYKNYFKLNSEIIRCKGNVKIISAYINNFNELVIKNKRHNNL